MTSSPEILASSPTFLPRSPTCASPERKHHVHPGQAIRRRERIGLPATDLAKRTRSDRTHVQYARILRAVAPWAPQVTPLAAQAWSPPDLVTE